MPTACSVGPSGCPCTTFPFLVSCRRGRQRNVNECACLATLARVKPTLERPDSPINCLYSHMASTGFSQTIRFFFYRNNKRRVKKRTYKGISSLIYKWYRGTLSSNGDALPVETDPEGPETIAGGAVPVDTTTLLKGVSPSAIVPRGEIKLILADAKAVELPEVLVTVLELDAEPSILVSSVVSANKFRYTGIEHM